MIDMLCVVKVFVVRMSLNQIPSSLGSLDSSKGPKLLYWTSYLSLTPSPSTLHKHTFHKSLLFPIWTYYSSTLPYPSSSCTMALPANVHISKHPCIRAKISQLRSTSTTPREFKALIHEIALMVACEALANSFEPADDGTVRTHLCRNTTTAHANHIPLIFIFFSYFMPSIQWDMTILLTREPNRTNRPLETPSQSKPSHQAA
jgi:hypothetical protein